MKKQETTKKGTSKAKATKKADAKKNKKELIRALSGKPAKPQKKTTAKKAARTKKAVTPKKAVKKITAKKMKSAAKKPVKKAKATKAKPAPVKANPEKLKKPVSKKAASVKKIVKPEKPTKTEERKPLPQERYEELPPLPVGYDADKAVSMPVTPRQLYVYWEITGETLSKYKGSLNIKVMNLKTNAFFYPPISERIGKQFLSVGSEGKYAVEIGVIDRRGKFIPIVRSMTSETPASRIVQKEAKEEREAEETELPEEFFETPESISSY